MKRSLAGAVAVAMALLFTPAAHADGDTFTSVPLPFFWPDAELRDLDADDAGDVWIAGAQGAYCVSLGAGCTLFSPGNPVVRRWNGSSWKEYPLKGWTGQGPMDTVTAWGGETWIAGTRIPEQTDYLARFDGTAFRKVEKPNRGALNTIHTGPAGTWLSHFGVDESGHWVHRRTGSTWTGYDFPLNTLNDLQALTATDAWAVGSRFVGPGPEVVPAMAHFDGSTWTAVTPPPIPASISSTFLRVAPVGPNDVWALARRDLAHWNGTDWTVIPLPREFTAGRDLAVDGNGDPWVTPFTGARVPYRYSGGTWHPATIPSGKVMSYITAIPGTSTIWGVAHSGGYVDPMVLKNG